MPPSGVEPRPPIALLRAPLVPVALAVTAGIVLDHLRPVPLHGSLLFATTCLAVWVVILWSGRHGLARIYLLLALLALGAAWHHYCLRIFPPDDIGELATETPQVVRVRGAIEDY